MKATFENTVDILVKAYLNDTLERVNCSACAVGNLIRASGYPFPFMNKLDVPDEQQCWYAVVKGFRGEDQVANLSRDEGIKQIESTGYTIEQIDKIEYAFEGRDKLPSRRDTFNGLMAVVDVLAEINNVDLSVKESAKLLFVLLTLDFVIHEGLTLQPSHYQNQSNTDGSEERKDSPDHSLKDRV